MNKNSCCDNCKFFDKIICWFNKDKIETDISTQGLCKRHAPQPICKIWETAEEAYNNDKIFEIFFPKMDYLDFCGEWKEKENE